MIIIAKKDSSVNSSSSNDVSRLGEKKKKSSRWFRLNKEPESAFSGPEACFDVKKSHSEIEVGERVEILEGDDMYKTGLVLGVLDNIVQVVIDGREKKSRFFRSGSVRTCRTTVASTQHDTTKSGMESRGGASGVERQAKRRTNTGSTSAFEPSSSNEESNHTKLALYQQSSLIDQLENRSLVKQRVNDLLEDLVEDEHRPPVKYISFETETPRQSIIPAHLEQSMSIESTLTAPSIRASQHVAHEYSTHNLQGRGTKSSGVRSAGLGRIPDEPSGRTLDPPIIDVTAKVLKPTSSDEHIMLYRRKPAPTHQFLIGGTVQISDGVHKGRSARVTKLSDGLVQVQVGGSHAKVLLSPSLLRSLPDPPSSLYQLWHGTL